MCENFIAQDVKKGHLVSLKHQGGKALCEISEMSKGRYGVGRCETYLFGRRVAVVARMKDYVRAEMEVRRLVVGVDVRAVEENLLEKEEKVELGQKQKQKQKGEEKVAREEEEE